MISKEKELFLEKLVELSALMSQLDTLNENHKALIKEANKFDKDLICQSEVKKLNNQYNRNRQPREPELPNILWLFTVFGGLVFIIYFFRILIYKLKENRFLKKRARFIKSHMPQIEEKAAAAQPEHQAMMIKVSQSYEETEKLKTHINKLSDEVKIPKRYRSTKYIASLMSSLRSKWKYDNEADISESIKTYFKDYDELMARTRKENKARKESGYISASDKHMQESLYYKRKFEEYYRAGMGLPPVDSSSDITRALNDYEEDYLSDFIHDIGGGDI